MKYLSRMVQTTWLDRYDAFILDIDGVLVRGSQPISGAVDALRTLQRRGPTLLLTNNSSRSRKELAAHLAGLGFPIGPEDVIPSSFVAARYLAEREGSIAYWLVGEDGLDAEMRLAGHRPSPRPEDADWVVVGIDRRLDYEILARALRALGNGASLLATNADATFPAAGEILPGAGAMVGAIRGMGFDPEAVVGKPSPISFRHALDLLDGHVAKTLMIGDRIETDIAGAAEIGLHTALVLTGVTDRPRAEETNVPTTWIAESLEHLARGSAERGPGAAEALDDPPRDATLPA